MATVPPQGPDPARAEDTGFEQEVRALVNETAPRVFAVVVEDFGESTRRDASIVAWGMVDDRGTVRAYEVENGTMMSLRSPARAVQWFGRLARRGTSRLVWVGESDVA